MKNENLIDEVIFLSFQAIVTLLLAAGLLGCGSLKVSGNTTHTVQGTATIAIKMEVFDVCNNFQGQQKNDCIQEILTMLNTLAIPKPVTGAL